MANSFRSLIAQAYTKSATRRSKKGSGQHKGQPRAPRVVPRVTGDAAYGASAAAPNDPAYKKSHPTSRSDGAY